MTSFFITSTGTGIGKTYVTCGLIAALQKRGIPVDAVKPVISGFEVADAPASDTGLILKALGRELDEVNIGGVSPWRFAAGISPDMAAAREGRSVSLEAVTAFCRESHHRGRICLIEGAGGVMSPIGQDFSNLDLIIALNAHALLVSGTYLGTISHTLTACEALKARRCNPWSVVLSQSEDSPVTMAETAQAIRRFTREPTYLMPRFAEVPEDLVEAIVNTHGSR